KVQIPAGADPKAAVLLENTLLTVTPDGKIVERYRNVTKILRPQGREYAKPVARFNKDHKLLSFQIWSIGPDGHQYTVDKHDIIEAGEDEWASSITMRGSKLPMLRGLI